MAKIEIRPALITEWEAAMDVVWRTFLRFEADEYEPEGVENFWEFIHDETLEKMFRVGQYRMFVAILNEEIVGVITLRDGTHISLLFVDEMYHRRGIGSQLIEHLANYLKNDMGKYFMTVNASPYGLPFYRSVGFTELGPEVKQRGIIYTPMRLVLDGKETN